MEIESLFGLPAHPLIVHAAVVLVPLSALGALLCLVPSLRRRIGVFVVALALAATVAVGLAQGSGEELEEQVDETELVEEHASMGDTLLPWVAVMTAAVGGLVLLDRRDGDASWVRPAVLATSAILVLTSVAGTVRVVQIGHSGAEATWSETADEGGGDAGEIEDRRVDHDEDDD